MKICMRFIYNLFLNKMFFFFLRTSLSRSLSSKPCFLTWSVSLALTAECLSAAFEPVSPGRLVLLRADL